MNTLKDRLEHIMAGPPKIKPAALARACKVKPPSVSDWLSGRTKQIEGQNLLRAADFLGVSPQWLASGGGPIRIKDANPSRYYIREFDSSDDKSMEIPLTSAQGSCGGGTLSDEVEGRPALVKEASWFKRYKIKPHEALAVWADGDSMADFIIDGDIVIFNKSRTTPKSGNIFLIEHPDGLRIKLLRRDISGAWILESKNSDKRAYPDEVITPDQSELLKILGEFVYRQGG